MYKDQTVLQRSEPISRNTFMGEQTNPSDRFQPEDVLRRHRGHEPPVEFELSQVTMLLTPRYFL